MGLGEGKGTAGPSLIKKKSTGTKKSDQNSDITVYAEENFTGNSQTFEVSNSQFKTNFDICFKEPVKSIIIAGIKAVNFSQDDFYHFFRKSLDFVSRAKLCW